MRFPFRVSSAWAVTLALTSFPALVTTAPETAPRFTDSLAFYEATAAQVPVAATSPSVNFSVDSVEGHEVLAGSAPVSAGAATIDLSGLGPGYYDLSVSNSAGETTTALGLVSGLSKLPASSPFGTTAHPAIHTAALDQSAVANAVGATTVRVDWRWEDAVTSTPSVYSWDAATEAEINRLLARGMRPTLVLAYHGLCDGGRTPSSNACIKQYVDFVRATALKYGANVEYAIYNEFNAETNTSKCGRTPDCYMKLLRPASEEIRKVAPKAKVTGPALGATDDWWAVGGNAYNWFQRFVALGGHKYVDDITIHNYSLSTAPEGYSERAVAHARAILAAAGSSQPVVLEEAGYNTVTGGQPEYIQAAFLVRDAAAVLAAGASKYMHYGLIDNWDNPGHPEANFGLVHHEDRSNGRLEPKPAGIAQAVLARFLDGAAVQASPALGADARSSVFQLSDGSFGHIVWSTNQMHTLLIQGGGHKSATDIYGRNVPLYTEGNVASVGIGGFPILLRTETAAALSLV